MLKGFAKLRIYSLGYCTGQTWEYPAHLSFIQPTSIYCVGFLCRTGQWWYIDREKDTEPAHIVLSGRVTRPKMIQKTEHSKCKGPGVAGACPLEEPKGSSVSDCEGEAWPSRPQAIWLRVSLALLSSYSPFHSISAILASALFLKHVRHLDFCLKPLYLLFPLLEHSFPRFLHNPFLLSSSFPIHMSHYQWDLPNHWI